MHKIIKNIGILTSGGDCPGMNNAVRSIIKTAYNMGLTPYLIFNGYKGLCEGKIKIATEEESELFGKSGGTFIGSSRLPEFKEVSVREKAIEQLNKHNIEALIVIGGDGSYMGAKKLTEMGINCIGLPGTIDNDIASSTFTIGFDTCLNTIVDAVDKIRDTSNSHNRCCIIETMGRDCGDLALFAGIAADVDLIITPKTKLTEEEVIEAVKIAKQKNKKSFLIITTEHLYKCEELAKKITQTTKFETRATILGYIQRGGKPLFMDRFITSLMGVRAIELLLEGKGGRCLGFHFNEIVDYDILQALNLPQKNNDKLYQMVNKLTKKGK